VLLAATQHLAEATEIEYDESTRLTGEKLESQKYETGKDRQALAIACYEGKCCKKRLER